jgi:hypothetical protein
MNTEPTPRTALRFTRDALLVIGIFILSLLAIGWSAANGERIDIYCKNVLKP